MKNPVYEQIQATKVKARLRMLQHARGISQGEYVSFIDIGVTSTRYTT